MCDDLLCVTIFTGMTSEYKTVLYQEARPGSTTTSLPMANLVVVGVSYSRMSSRRQYLSRQEGRFDTDHDSGGQYRTVGYVSFYEAGPPSEVYNNNSRNSTSPQLPSALSVVLLSESMEVVWPSVA